MDGEAIADPDRDTGSASHAEVPDQETKRLRTTL